MIPPSIALIIYGFLTETSVVRLFTAGIVPGVILAGMFSALIIFQGVFRPSSLGDIVKEKMPFGQVVKNFVGITPVLLLIAIVLGTIYGGVATPTEAAALGCVGATIIAVAYRQFTWQGMFNAIKDTVVLMAIIGFIMFGAMAMTFSVSHLGLGPILVNILVDMQVSPYAAIFMLYGIYILLGCVMDALALLLIIVPVAFPVVMALGFDPVWFGIAVVLGQELACITPPIGVNLWVVQGITGVSMEELTKAILPFFFILIMFLVVLTFVPQLATWLPDLIL